jgi:hypothetical protein
MQRKEPHEKKGLAGLDALPENNILTRRANQGHTFIIAQFVRLPFASGPIINTLSNRSYDSVGRALLPQRFNQPLMCVVDGRSHSNVGGKHRVVAAEQESSHRILHINRSPEVCASDPPLCILKPCRRF